MSEHRATITWKLVGSEFTKGRFSREHTWTFDGGWSMPASPSPTIVPPPFSNPRLVDPEEAFVASIASCHMLTWLYLASRRGFEVMSYQDDAVGTIAKNESGALWVSAVTLRPKIAYGKAAPTAAETADLHKHAHEQCFIANSVRTHVTVQTAENVAPKGG